MFWFIFNRYVFYKFCEIFINEMDHTLSIYLYNNLSAPTVVVLPPIKIQK